VLIENASDTEVRAEGEPAGVSSVQFIVEVSNFQVSPNWPPAPSPPKRIMRPLAGSCVA
jgi:hypothetical protein